MGWGERQEPVFSKGAKREPEMRLDASDRPGSGAPRPAKRGERRQPTFEPSMAPRRDRFDDADDRRASAPRKETAMARRGRDRDDDSDYDNDRPPPRRKSGGGGGRGGSSRRKHRGIFGRLAYWGVVAGVWALIAVGGVVGYYAAKLPPIDSLTVPKRPPNIAILADDGALLANRGETGGSTVALKELPPYLPKAFIAIEDRRFYSHFGIDPIGLTRALTHAAISCQFSQGGSTLTQQLAKNLFLTQERTLGRKVQEAILALWLERKYTKDQILELYLNRVYFGSGAYGVEAAAQKYYGKSARNVTLAEAASLAGLVQAPSRLAPNRNPQGAAARAAQVVTDMVQQGYVTDQAAKVALASPAEARHQAGAGSANYAADWVMDVLDDYVGAIDKDIVVRTTISTGMQQAAERAVVDELNSKGAKFNVSQGALVAMAPDGSVKALVGGRSYTESQFNRAISARRQPGSSFKPFVYLTALERGMTPETLLTDAPINIKGWQPENYTRGQYFGQIPMMKSLIMSLNTPVVRLVQDMGPKTVIRTAQRLGITAALQPNVSLALGTSEVTPLEMAAAYTTFADGGVGVVPHVIAEVKTTDGKVLYRSKSAGPGRVIEPGPLSMLDAMLHENTVSGTAKKGDVPGWQAGGKTGTTQDYKDAWFCGFTAYLTAVVWLGNDDGDPMKKVTGGGLPVEVWDRFMREVHKGVTPVPLPGSGWTPSGASGDAPLADNSQTPRPHGFVPVNAGNNSQDGNAALPYANGPSGAEKNLLQRLIGG